MNLKARRVALFISLFSAIFMVLSPSALPYQQVELIREIGEYKAPPGQGLMNSPVAVAIFGERIYIAEADANRVLALNKDGKILLRWGTKGDGDGQFRSPSGIAIDEQGNVYVSDYGNNRIQVFSSDGAFIRSFGRSGSGPKQFREPRGIEAFRGLLYVADSGNRRVQILSYDGVYMGETAIRTKKDEMKSPVDVAVDVQNRIYVIDSEGHRVRIFDPTGSEIKSFGAKGSGVEGFSNPASIAVDAYGQIYVSDTGNHKLKKFDAQGRLLASIGSEGEGPGQFKSPLGLTVDRTGAVYILDAEKNTLQVFTSEKDDAKPLSIASPLPSIGVLKEISIDKPGASGIAFKKRLWGLTGDSIAALGVIGGRQIGASGSDPGMFKNPKGIAIDNSGSFWVADTGNNRLQKLSREGNLLQVIGKKGSGEAEFRSPWAIAVSPKGNIHIADTRNRRIQVLNSKGLFLGVFGKEGKQPGRFMEPVDLSVDSAENIYVVDREKNTVSKYDSTGVLIWEVGRKGAMDAEFNSPESILVTADNEVYVLDSGNNRVQVFDASTGRFLRKFGNEGSGPGEFRSPRGLALEDGIRLYVGDRGNRRVQVFAIKHTPAIPSGIAAQAHINEIQLSWKQNRESYIEHYKIYRADSATGEFRFIGTATEPFYIDRGLSSNCAFHYRVSSQALGGNESAPSDIASAVTPRLIPSNPRKVAIEAGEKQITLAWLPNTEPFVDHYRIYRTKQLSAGFELLSKSDKTVYVDSLLADETIYYYQITAVGKDGDESPPSEVVFASTPKASLTAPPLEITKIDMTDLFASAYKYYETHPLGRVTIRNNTDKTYPKVMLRFSLKKVMDYPSEIEITELKPREELTLDIKPVFSNRILEITENTSLQSKISLTYHVAGEPRTADRTFPVTLYERHAMTWDKKEKAAAFVTPHDPVVADFSRSVIQPYVDAYPNLHPTLVYGRAIFAGLGVYGLSYIIDPTSPYQEFSENVAQVDYLQYPRDTISRKSGDCDDLSVLFAAAMENIGIPSALVDVPGHVFVMFNTGVPEADRKTLGLPDQLLVIYNGTVWIPIEMTLVGSSSFTRAWQKAAAEYRDWSAKKAVDIIEIQKAWESFKPATLPKDEIRPPKVAKEDIEAKFNGELEALARQRLLYLSNEYIEALKKNPADTGSMTALGILYGENGMLTEALEQFQKILAVDKTDAAALNNIGNISLLQERLEDARQAYESALKSAPDDVGIMSNLARVLLRSGKKDKAKKLFQEAASIDPRVNRRYCDLASELGLVK